MRLIKYLGVGLCFLLSACDAKQSDIHPSDSSASESIIESDAQAEVEEGRRLTEVAGRTTLPSATDQDKPFQKNPLSKQAQAYIGRYHVVVDCTEKFALCEKEGKVEFVISLLKDGTSHRTLIYLGKMSYEKNKGISNRMYQHNTWTYNPETHQIEVKRSEGVNFYYDVTKNGDLVIDLDQIYANNKVKNGQFRDGSYVPTQEYLLKKLS
ncbi:hypothetical protein DJ533_17020 [Acinetobacter defluvii]|uniref:Lipoprotein n=1 Tax=Acinetobacter defluvii TaxID=1871111 RepID=A0A2S2FIF5_9GAMM|nr:hypothetical protein [Acinetobacter defluvii]AWL30142.1 hypothetical protein DJ533_17020 [Acinetobacter defluvii]